LILKGMNRNGRDVDHAAVDVGPSPGASSLFRGMLMPPMWEVVFPCR
jgi:hypothetical protein